MARLEDYYRETLVKELQATLGLDNVMEVPRLSHITLNMGLGEAVGDKKIIEKAVEDMALISGQKPVVQCHVNQSLDSRFVIIGQLVVWLLCVAKRCMSF